MAKTTTIILGGGITGLSAGISSGMEIYEAATIPGGICASYYIDSKGKKHYALPGTDAYRFEIGGGHWIFGADKDTLDFIKKFSSVKSYERDSAVFFPDRDLYVPYPLQNHLSYLPKGIGKKALDEISGPQKKEAATLAEWLEACFGRTLCELFFFPFHELYTAGLYTTIAPRDVYKSPVSKELIMKGFKEMTPSVGYNATFVYPRGGLDELIRKMAEKGKIHFKKKAIKIDVNKKKIVFDDGCKMLYESIVSTVPLNRMIKMTGIDMKEPCPPHTSVLVLNIGAKRGQACPAYHWLYIPESDAGFHRVGFYSNVDKAFLPYSSRDKNDRVSIYVEKAFRGGQKPKDLKKVCSSMVDELKKWEFIGEVEAADPTWIEIAYTWEYPDSQWKQRAIASLKANGIHQLGRYGKWHFQGIAESMGDGLNANEVFYG